MWIQGEEDCASGWLPEYMYTLSEYNAIVSIIYKQYRAKQISYEDFGGHLDSMGIK